MDEMLGGNDAYDTTENFSFEEAKVSPKPWKKLHETYRPDGTVLVRIANAARPEETGPRPWKLGIENTKTPYPWVLEESELFPRSKERPAISNPGMTMNINLTLTLTLNLNLN